MHQKILAFVTYEMFRTAERDQVPSINSLASTGLTAANINRTTAFEQKVRQGNYPEDESIESIRTHITKFYY